MRAVTRAVFSLCGQNGKKDENKNIHDCKNFSITTLLFQTFSYYACLKQSKSVTEKERKREKIKNKKEREKTCVS